MLASCDSVLVVHGKNSSDIFPYLFYLVVCGHFLRSHLIIVLVTTHDVLAVDE